MYRSMKKLHAGSIDLTQWLPTSCSWTLEHWNVAVGAVSDALQKHVSINHHIHRHGRQVLSTYRVVKLSYCLLYKDVSKSSRTVPVKRSLLTLDVKCLHYLQSTPLLQEYSGPSVSAMLGSIPGSPFLELCQVPAAIPLESLQWCRIFDPSSEA